MTLEVPDEPRWIEAHGMAGDPASWRREGAIGNDAAQLIVLLPGAEAAQASALAAAYPRHAILSEREALARATGRAATRALLHALPDPAALAELEGAVALPDDVSLAHVPAALAEELAAARARRTVWSVFLDGVPVSFAYAPWRSARWFDVSVDTLPGARQLGLGRLVAAAMIHAERALGREPVWGADEANAGSLALARTLGFDQVDELWVAPP